MRAAPPARSCVTVGGIESLLRGLRVVVQVDQVVRHARVLWLALQDRLQYCRSLWLLA